MRFLRQFDKQTGIERNRFFRAHLSNGALLIGEYRPSRKLSIGARILHGSALDPSGKEGLHHFLEHLLFKSQTDTARSRLVSETENLGGEANACTTNLYTEVFCTVPSRKSELGLRFVTELVGQPPTATPHDLGTERQVVLIEMAKYHDNPEMNIDDLLEGDSLHPPFNNPVVGTVESLESISLKDVIQAWERGYHPENMIFSFVGDADPELVGEYIEKAISSRGGFIRKKFPLATHFSNNNVYPRQGVKQATLGFSFNSYPSTDLRSYTGNVLDTFLTFGEASFLFRELRGKRGLIYNLSSNLNQTPHYGTYEIVLAARPSKIDLVREIMLQGFREAGRITREEFKRLKILSMDFEDMQERTVSETREDLVEAEMDYGNGEEAYMVRERISAVTHEEFVEAANYALVGGYSSSFIVPE